MQIQTKKRLSWLSALLIVALLCTASFLFARWSVERGQTVIRTANQITAKPNQKITVMDDGVIYLDTGVLHALDSRGRQSWVYTAGSNADYHVGSGGVSAWSGNRLSLLTKGGETLYSGTLEHPVIASELGQQYAAVQVGEDEHNSSMLILEPGGRQVDLIEMTNSTVLDFGFFSGGSLLWVMTLNTEGTTPLCLISTYRPAKALSGTIRETEQILYQVMFQSSFIRVVGTTYLKSYDYTGKEIAENRKLVYGWYMLDSDHGVDNPLMAFAPLSQSGGVPSVSDVRLIKGDIDETIRLATPCFRLFAKGETLYAFSKQYVLVARLGGSQPVAYRMPVDVDNVLDITMGNTAIVASGGAIYMVPLP